MAGIANTKKKKKNERTLAWWSLFQTSKQTLTEFEDATDPKLLTHL